MVISQYEINRINKALERGDKQQLSKHIGVTPQTLSRYFKEKTIPRAKYKLLIEFITQITHP